MKNVRRVLWMAGLALVLTGCLDSQRSRLPTDTEPKDSTKDVKRGFLDQAPQPEVVRFA